MSDSEEVGASEIAFISDIHSNLEALEAVLSEIVDLPKYCLGDLVGYGASPNEVIDLLRKNDVKPILGNHDHAVIAHDFHDFNSTAAIAIGWTAKHLTKENTSYLASLPRERRITIGTARLYLTHGSPDDTLWEYVDPATHSDLFGYYLDKLSVSGMGLGHTHVPYLWAEGNRLVFNPGSVGQPRSGDNRASFAVMKVKEGGKMAVEHKLTKYDIELSARKIEREGLPETLGRRLFVGH